MDPKVCGKLLTTHRRGYGVDVESLHAPTKAPRWDLADTESYGGGNCVSLAPWMFSGYMGIYWRKKYVGGAVRGPRGWGARLPPWARPPTSWMPRGVSDFNSKSSGLLSVQERSSRRFHSVWTPFGIPFLQNSKIGKKTETGTGPPFNRLVPKII